CSYSHRAGWPHSDDVPSARVSLARELPTSGGFNQDQTSDMGLNGNIYSWFLRLPHFKGKGRIENLMRRAFFSTRVWRVAYDLKMELNPLEWTEITLIRDGLIEPKTISLFDRLLEEGDTYVDVGAHVGFHTLVARRKVGEA